MRDALALEPLIRSLLIAGLEPGGVPVDQVRRPTGRRCQSRTQACGLLRRRGFVPPEQVPIAPHGQIRLVVTLRQRGQRAPEFLRVATIREADAMPIASQPKSWPFCSSLEKARCG
jgi:hypothetical protein